MRFAREITALIAAPVAVWIVGWSHAYVFDVAVAAIGILAMIEFLTLGRRKGYDIPIPLCVVVTLILMTAFILPQLSVELGVFVALLVIPAWYVLGARPLDDSLPSSAVSVLATTYVGMLGGSLIRLRNDFPDGAKLVFFLLLVVWMGDTGAYYFGRAFGRHKMSPRISPKKTIEGGIGGVFTSVVAAVIIHFTFFPAFPLLHAIIAGVILSIAGMIGDLTESMWKRSADVKDSGTLLPGHGGMLDRFDSIFFTTPILYCYWTLIVHGFRTLNIMQG
ncbi:MAG: phosphatidate cytidylyltransferase [Acidobacteria bacterium]|nr:phosphatidate cytidylyltransferase [Acidobacteriota bacterium]MBV9476514.1 phosphatidate cytidylyltransferase [Acidobacteriota bacterium]